VISDIWRCDSREILPLMLDSALRECDESPGTRCSERHSARKVPHLAGYARCNGPALASCQANFFQKMYRFFTVR
jgi:hypothetical protein